MLKEKIQERDNIAEVCLMMEAVIKNTTTTKEYQKSYIEKIRSKKVIEQEIRDIFDNMRSGRTGNYYYANEFIAEEMTLSTVDDGGNFIMERVLTGIEPLDEQFLENTGLMLEGVMTIGGDAEVGKSYFIYNMIFAFITQGYSVHFHSYEVSRKQLLSDFVIKRKIGSIVDNEEQLKKLTIDLSAYNIEELNDMIRIRAYAGTRIFMIDSYSKIDMGTDDEYRKMKLFSDFCKKISMELGILIIIIAQISKSDQFNRVNDFSGGKALKYDSDYSFFISLVPGEESSGKRILYCEKNRDHEGFSKFGIVTGFNFKTKRMNFISKLDEYTDNMTLSDGKPVRTLKLGAKSKS